jgi:CRP-like cAMP-binding protein
MIYVYICTRDEIFMNESIQYSGCTISPRKCQCFEKLNDEERKMLEDNSVEIVYKKKEMICKQGALVSHVMHIESGLVKIFIEDGSNSLVLKVATAGNLVALTSVSEDQNRYKYSASAYVDTVIKQIDVKIFRQLINQNAQFAREVIDILSMNNSQIYGRFFCFTHKQSYGRVADILLCLSERVFKMKDFELPLSRRDLADLSGMSSETVIRILKQFDKDNLIKLKGKSILIQDEEQLRHISEKG